MGNGRYRWLGHCMLLATSLVSGGLCEPWSSPCLFQAHPGTTFQGQPNVDNVIACIDNEGLAVCESRCSGDASCTGFGIYTEGPRLNRCCTKWNNNGATGWDLGVSYTKKNSSCTPSLEVAKIMMFNCSGTWPYAHQGMLEFLPSGLMVGALQAGASEGASDQRVLVTRSADGGLTWAHSQLAVNSTGTAQWSPVLYFHARTQLLWLIYSEGSGMANESMVLYLTTSRDEGLSWSPRRQIASSDIVKGRIIWAVNKVVALPGGPLLLPCDTLRGSGQPSAAFALISMDAGQTWAPHGNVVVPNSVYPEAGMALVNGGSQVLAVIRGSNVGLWQATAGSNGQIWSTATETLIQGTSSKPALWSVEGTGPLLLSYNLGNTRLVLRLDASFNGGSSYVPVATLETGSSGLAACYPTIISAGQKIYVAYTVYGTSSIRRTGIRVAILMLPPS